MVFIQKTLFLGGGHVTWVRLTSHDGTWITGGLPWGGGWLPTRLDNNTPPPPWSQEEFGVVAPPDFSSNFFPPGVLRSTLPTMTLDESFEAKEKMAPWVWKRMKNGTVASSKVGFPYDPYGF